MATPIPTNRARFSIEEVARVTGGEIVQQGAADEAVGFVTDSRAVPAGGAFVALRGESHDGHAFVAAALERSAALVIIERGRGDAIAVAGAHFASVVEVPDTLVAWGDLARAHLAGWRGGGAGADGADNGGSGDDDGEVTRRVVAITGSAGKTTTKELTAALLSAVAPTHFTAGNLNNRVGVPAVVLALTDAHLYCVLEMGMSLPGELDAITSFARPDVALVTNVGVAHAEGVGGREGVMREKGAVYRALAEDGVAIVNADDDLATRASREGTRPCRAVTFGRSPRADYRLARRDVLEAAPGREGEGAGAGAGSLVRVVTAARDITVNLPLPGEAAAIDLCAAIAAQEAASGLELDPAQIEAALATVRLDGRAALRKLPGDVLVLDDTYNANPASMRASLATLAEIAGASRRRVVVVGEMKELGPVAEAEHDALGDAIADAIGSGRAGGAGLATAALAIGCGGLVDRALERAAARGVPVVRARNTEEAASEAASRLRPGDAVLVKASRSVGAERVVAALAKASESLPSL
jgi:UDP-N-acetylmuramoyl-tripeptide--D-alanyl-D-alanine ligase